MEPINPAVWFPVVTLIAGAFLKATFDLFNERRQEEREKRVRIEGRKETIQLRRNENQRKLLLEMQEAAAKLMRAVARHYLEDVTNHRIHGTWAKEPISEEVSNGARDAFLQVNLLRVRLLDEELRARTTHLSSLCSGVTMASSEHESERKWMDTAELFDQFNERLGEVLRFCDSHELAYLDS